LFTGFGIWWGMPLLVAAMVVALLLFSLVLPLRTDAERSGAEAAPGGNVIPPRFWVFAAFAVLYGICETMNGNWASLFMSTQLGVAAALASLALTVFWASVTAGRLAFAALDKWISAAFNFRALPLVVTVAFVITAFLPTTHPAWGLFVFAIAGLGCSALLPLLISFAQEELTAISASVAGGLIAFYQMGYGIAAFGVGPLQSHAGLSLGAIYGGTAIVALGMAILSFVIARREGGAMQQPLPRVSH
jgi:fucose permease